MADIFAIFEIFEMLLKISFLGHFSIFFYVAIRNRVRSKCQIPSVQFLFWLVTILGLVGDHPRGDLSITAKTHNVVHFLLVGDHP